MNVLSRIWRRIFPRRLRLRPGARQSADLGEWHDSSIRAHPEQEADFVQIDYGGKRYRIKPTGEFVIEPLDKEAETE